MAKRPTLQVLHCSAGGFTLVEVVIALAILAVVVSSVSLVHCQTLRLHRQTRDLSAALGPLERLAAGRMAGVDPRLVAADLRGEGWVAEADMHGGGVETLWEEWRLSPSNRPWSVVRVCLAPTMPAGGGR